MNNLFELRKYKCELAIKLGFKYNPETGDIISPTGILTKAKTSNGYQKMTLRFNNEIYYLTGHQFAWYMVYKECVENIDHINGIKTDNYILNLRSVDKSINALNQNNVKGVYFCKRSNKWIPILMDNYKQKWIGSFDNYEDARNKYLEEKEKLIQCKLQEQSKK